MEFVLQSDKYAGTNVKSFGGLVLSAEQSADSVKHSDKCAGGSMMFADDFVKAEGGLIFFAGDSAESAGHFTFFAEGSDKNAEGFAFFAETFGKNAWGIYVIHRTDCQIN